MDAEDKWDAAQDRVTGAILGGMSPEAAVEQEFSKGDPAMSDLSKVPVIDKDGKTIELLNAREYDSAGAVFIGSGLYRRTFAYRMGDFSPHPFAFIEVTTKDIPDPEVEAAILKLNEEQARVLDQAEHYVHTVLLPPGQRVRVQLMDSDGVFTVSYDWMGDRQVIVHSDMPGSVIGDEGVIYLERFGDGSMDGKVAIEPDTSVEHDVGPEPEDEAEAEGRLEAGMALATNPLRGPVPRFNTPEARVDLLVSLRAERSAGRISATDSAVLQTLEAWLASNARRDDAHHTLKALRLQDMRGWFCPEPGDTGENAMEFKALEAWEAGLLRQQERGEQLLIEAITAVLGALAPEADMTTIEVYQALETPVAGHPVGRLYILAIHRDENGRINALGELLSRLSRDKLLPTTRLIGGVQAAAYRLRRPGDPNGMTGMVHDRLSGADAALGAALRTLREHIVEALQILRAGDAPRDDMYYAPQRVFDALARVSGGHATLTTLKGHPGGSPGRLGALMDVLKSMAAKRLLEASDGGYRLPVAPAERSAFKG